MSLIQRKCPLCRDSEHDVIVALEQKDFVETNDTYNKEIVPLLALESDQQYPIVACRACRMVYSLYRLDDERLSIVYNRIIDPQISLEKTMRISRRLQDVAIWQSILRLLAGREKEPVNLKVLDFGCGWGSILQAASGPGVTTVGLDATGYKSEWAEKHGVIMCGSEAELENHQPFDLCISTSVLEHVSEPREVIGAMGKVMKPGGFAFIVCVIDEVASAAGWEGLRRNLADGKPITKNVNPWEHLNYFTKDSLTDLMKGAGFESYTHPDDRIRGASSLTGMLTAVAKSVHRRIQYGGNHVPRSGAIAVK
ncbi:MAG: class I SAM-dependent methyltransferase [Nitrospinaceae bacterium]|nr:class I SAM-dependent methyltransferase [Nitrospinaceae bacterium]